jgi:hypothetical protein
MFLQLPTFRYDLGLLMDYFKWSGLGYGYFNLLVQTSETSLEVTGRTTFHTTEFRIWDPANGTREY